MPPEAGRELRRDAIRDAGRGQGKDHGRRPPVPQDLWPRDFGRDGASGLVTLDRAMRARDAARPSLADELEAVAIVDSLLARIDGRRPRAYAR